MLQESFLRALSGLQLVMPKRHPGMTSGERRSPRRGRSMEFADYRNYTPGDDPRRVDWNIYARLERPYIKLYEDEQDLTVHVLLDASPSMQWREEDEEKSAKWERATQLAVALCYIALSSGDRLILETSSRSRLGPKRGTAATSAVIDFIDREMLTTGQLANADMLRPLSLNAWWKRYALDARPGLCIIISDLLDAEGYADGLNALGSSRLDVYLLHTLSPDELDPQFAGDLRLKDVETSAMQNVSLDDAALSQYRARLNRWTTEVAEFCRRRGGRYHLADTSMPIEQIILRDLRRAGWIV